MIQRILYYAAFYLCWGICIQQAAQGHGFVGPVIIGFAILLHLWLVDNRWEELKFILVVTIVGTLIDSIYLDSGFIHYHSLYPGLPWVTPLWVTSLYALFAAAFTESFGWLKNRWFLMVLFGAIGGPLSYLASIKVGAAEFLVAQPLALGILAVVWGAIFPLSFFLLKYLKR